MPSVTLQPGAADGIDTVLDQANPDTARDGIDNWFFATLYTAGRIFRSLIKFDLSSIPSGATVTSATFTAYSQGPPCAQLGMYQILTANSAWAEAGATWNKRDGTNNWAGSAGCGTADTDYASTADATYTGGASPAGTPRDISLDTSRFQYLLTTNCGWLFKATNESVTQSGPVGYFSEHATASYRPKLVVEYELPGSGGIFASSIFHSAIMGATLTR